jgi:hypothetical protein
LNEPVIAANAAATAPFVCDIISDNPNDFDIA